MSDESARFTPRMTAAARKRQIVEVALDLIAKHGLHGVTMSRIAAGAGIRQASLYSHFQSRHEILLAALDVIYERIYASRMTRSEREHARSVSGRSAITTWSCGRARESGTTPSCCSSSSPERRAKACARPWPPSTWRRSRSSSRSWSGARRKARSRRTSTPSRWPGSSPASPSPATSRRPWASSTSSTRRSSGHWLDVMFASFVAAERRARARRLRAGALPTSRPHLRSRLRSPFRATFA